MTILRAVLQKLTSTRKAEAANFSLGGSAKPEAPAALHHLLQSRQLLEVTQPGRQRSYQSMIIAIDVERRLLWLDDLFPAQRLLEMGDEITVRHHRSGEVLSFTTPILAWGHSFGASGIAVALPELVDYQPRRQAPRCDLSGHTPITAKFRLLGQKASYGTVKDISTEGLCVLAPGNLLAHLHHGTVLPLCEVHLNKQLHIHCRALVRSFRLCREPFRATQISLEFIDLPPKRKLELREFVARFRVQDIADSRAA